MITRISLVIAFLFISHLGFGQSGANSDIKRFEIEFNKILVDLDSVIANSKNQNETVVNHYNYIKNKIYNSELQIVLDTTLKYDFYDCASFNITVDNPKDVTISFGQFVVDKYESFPALIYAIIISTFQSAYDYYNNHELFLISTSNLIEKTYFELDAMILEAIFLEVYMKNSDELGHLERLLIADLPDNLRSSSMLFMKADIDLLHKIDDLKTQSKSADKLLKEFNAIGKDLIKSVTFNSDSKWVNYCSLVKLKTYVYYSQQVIFDIVHLKDRVSADKFKLEKYKDNLITINQLIKIINDNNSYLNYHQETLDIFSDYYRQ